jgi:hypothetical protein
MLCTSRQRPRCFVKAWEICIAARAAQADRLGVRVRFAAHRRYNGFTASRNAGLDQRSPACVAFVRPAR